MTALLVVGEAVGVEAIADGGVAGLALLVLVERTHSRAERLPSW